MLTLTNTGGLAQNADGSYKWTGSALRPTVQVTHVPTGTVLASNAYTVEYVANTDAGTATVNIKGKSATTSYAVLGTADMTASTATLLTTTFDIKYNLDDMAVVYDDMLAGSQADMPAYDHTGSAIEKGELALAAAPTVKVPQEDYVRTWENNVDLGTQKAKTTAVPNQADDAAAAKWTAGTATEQTGYFSIVEAPTITTRSNTYYDIAKGVAYSLQLEYEVGNEAPYDSVTWSMVSGALPAGLTLDPATGLISGIPQAVNTATAVIKATNLVGDSATESYTWKFGDVYGQAVDQDGRPVSGVVVTVKNTATGADIDAKATNSQGVYSILITDENFPSQVTVTAQASPDGEGRPQRVTAINGSAAAAATGAVLSLTAGSPSACPITVERAVKVTFNTGADGSVDNPVQYGYAGDALTLPSVHSVTPGKQFDGWSTTQGALVPDAEPTAYPDADTTYHAVYSDKWYTVTYLDTGDTLVPAGMVRYDDDGFLPAQVTREGYRFKEWRVAGTNTVVTDSTKYSDIASASAEGVTLQAVWEIRSDIQVTLDANGSTTLPATIGGAASKVYTDRTYGATIGGIPRRSGYTFVGWSLKKTLTTAVDQYEPQPYVIVPDPLYVEESLRDSESAVTYYAIWEAENIAVTYDPMGGEFGTGEDGLRTGMPGDPYTVPQNPVRKGYTFLGWFTTPTGTLAAPAGGTIPTASATYYAQWKANEVTLTLVATGAVPERQTLDGTYSDVVKYELQVKDGYSFVGWKLPDNTVAYFIAFPAQSATYQAVFEKNQIVVAFNAMGGEFAADESGQRKGQLGDAYELPAAPTREGYDFGGWYTTYACETPMPTDRKIPAASVTYYAKWTPKEITVTLNENYGDTPAQVEKTGAYGSTVDYTAPEREGYAFLGWKESTVADDSSAVMSLAYPSRNRTYYAVWQQGAAVVLYNPMGGKLAAADGDGRYVGMKDDV